MTSALAFLAAQLAPAIFGAGAGFHPSARSMSVASRAAVSLGAGAVALTLEATVFSLVGIPWTVLGLSLPLCAISAACAMRWRRLPSQPREAFHARPVVLAWSGLVGGVAFLFLVLSLGSSLATSTDFLFFWGVKAVRFAHARGISAEFLRGPFTFHAVPDYPPLLPVVQAWGCLVAGKMPWRTAPVVSAIWLAASIPIVLERFRRVLGDDGAASVAGFWTAALSISLVYSYSGGNAEAPLLFFETVALAWLMTELGPSESRIIPVIALCGAALTKVEGSVAVALIAAGAMLLSEGRGRARQAARALVLAAVPATAVGIWFLYQASRRLPVGYAAHGVLFGLHPANSTGIVAAMLRSLNSGSLWIPWILPFSLLSLFPAAMRRVLPALLQAGGLLAFFFFDYLHDAAVPSERIGWTLPRVSQPALSAAILAAGLASLSPRFGTPRHDRAQ
jgi:hypothetical protein